MKGKTVIITGGSLGIGKALAKEFGKRGSHILITGRKKEALDRTTEELRNDQIIVYGLQADVTVEEDNKKMVREAIGRYGKIDVLINNAGISMYALFEECEVDVIKRVMNTNFYGTLYATHHCMPHLMQSKGSIIGISSIAGYCGLPGRTGYSASKFALNGFLEALSLEVSKKGVHVLTAAPNFTASNIRKTSLTKDGSEKQESSRDESKVMSAQECAQHIYKAHKKRKKRIILTAQGKALVFLSKWIPRLSRALIYDAMKKEKDSLLH